MSKVTKTARNEWCKLAALLALTAAFAAAAVSYAGDVATDMVVSQLQTA